jgi:hypothetical protein
VDRIVLEAALAKQLAHIYRPTELVDASGQVLGHFLPPYTEEDLDPGVSDEELQRREQAGGGRPLADILADLRRRS